mmetsp:Transcript_1822/g.3976  ORF Transcript_1822/g.3976 Transcript_1822/m.3976 type:complete len:431 (+) Transcript_1822:148-1440(+)
MRKAPTIIGLALLSSVDAFTACGSAGQAGVFGRNAATTNTASTNTALLASNPASDAATTTTTTTSGLTDRVERLKKVLQREYVSFFDPMQCEYYSDSVSFEDPMTALEGVDKYKNNVDMLASRTLLGKFLFRDAGIVLHKVEGGEVNAETGAISNIVTRWTLRVTAKAIPWNPTARFTGISVYEVSKGGSEGVVVDHQTDYWDSINIVGGGGGDGDRQGTYAKVDKAIAVGDFLDQLKPDNGNAAAAGMELPYQLLRRGKDYELRRYPSYTAATIPYDRRDEGYDVLASLTQGIAPLAPSVMVVPNGDNDDNDGDQKSMSWPLAYAAPGESAPPPLPQAITDRDSAWSGDSAIATIPPRVVAVGSFSDASVAPIVRKADAKLRAALARDGIGIPTGSESSVKFAQYDAIFSLGKRRGEVWIELDDDGHPY